MFVTRHKLFTADRESIHQKSQKVGRHLTVVYKTGYRTDLAPLDFLFQLFHHTLGRNIVDKHIGIARNLAAITAIYLIADKYLCQICLDNIFQKHQVVILSLPREFHKTRQFAVRHFDNIILHLSRFGAAHPYSQILSFVAEEHAYPSFLNLYRLKVGKNFFHKETMYKIAVKRLYLPLRLIENNMIIP